MKLRIKTKHDNKFKIHTKNDRNTAQFISNLSYKVTTFAH